MSQQTVERIIGRLVTDEAFRQRFARDANAVLDEVAGTGCPLNPCERRALSALDVDRLERFAEAIDPRLAKVDLRGGIS